MTTTPDSRIRADFGLDPIDTSTTVTPDTSTTAGKVAVMQAAERIESTPLNPRDHAYGLWTPVTGMAWNWGLQDYRIAPPTERRTALQSARDLRSRITVVNSASAEGIICRLLTDIDHAPVVEVLERRISWDAADLSALPKGRYRLVRDEA